MRTFTGIIYRWIIKPILFRFPADTVHELFTKFGAYAGRHGWLRTITRILWNYENARLAQKICGISFRNPIGLSAGFD